MLHLSTPESGARFGAAGHLELVLQVQAVLGRKLARASTCSDSPPDLLDVRVEGGNVLAGDGAVWVATSGGTVLHVDPDSQTVAKPIPLGTLIYPANPRDTLAVGEGSVWVAVTSFAS